MTLLVFAILAGISIARSYVKFSAFPEGPRFVGHFIIVLFIIVLFALYASFAHTSLPPPDRDHQVITTVVNISRTGFHRRLEANCRMRLQS